MCENINKAHGVTTVCSDARPECHAPSAKDVRKVSAACTCKTCRELRAAGLPVPGVACPTYVSPRAIARDTILAFWEAQGVARWQRGGAGGGGRWMVRDMAQGGAEWLPLAGQADAGRADVAEFSHVRSAANGGAWCACNLLPENGAVNAARGDANVTDLTPEARALLAAWPEWWRANVARKASLARLSA